MPIAGRKTEADLRQVCATQTWSSRLAKGYIARPAISKTKVGLANQRPLSPSLNRVHMVEEETRHSQVVLWPRHRCTSMSQQISATRQQQKLNYNQRGDTQCLGHE